MRAIGPTLLFVRRSADYFDETLATDPFLHTWSLAVEEQYYLAFAPMCLILATTARRRSYDLFRRRLFAGAVVVSIASFVGCLMQTAAQPLASFYGFPSRAWEFGIGGILALQAPRNPFVRSQWNHIVAIIALIGVVSAWFIADTLTPHPGWITLLPVLGTAALIRIGARGPNVVGWLLENPVARLLGRLSYSWYLWHWPLTIYWTKLVPSDAVPLVIGMPLASLILAQLTYVTIEAPARRVACLQGPLRGLMAALVLAVVTSAAGGTSLLHARHRLGNPEYDFIFQAKNTPTRLDADGCLLTSSEVEPKVCIYGNQASDTTVVLFGDSHAAQWFAALEPVVLARGARIAAVTKSACPPVSVTVRSAIGRAFVECDRWRENALRHIAAMKPALIVMANSSWYSVFDGDSGPVKSRPRPLPARWGSGLRATLDQLPRSTPILLLEDSPRPLDDVPRCLIEHLNEVWHCAFRRDAAVVQEISILLRALERDDPRVTYVDLTDRICDGPVCPAARVRMALYADSNHLSVSFAASLSPWLEPVFDMVLRSGPRLVTQQPE